MRTSYACMPSIDLSIDPEAPTELVRQILILISLVDSSLVN